MRGGEEKRVIFQCWSLPRGPQGSVLGQTEARDEPVSIWDAAIASCCFSSYVTMLAPTITI